MNHIFKTIHKKMKGFTNTTVVVSENGSSLSHATDNRCALSKDMQTADIFTATKQVLSMSMASLLFVSSLQADIIADKSAPITQQPTILLTNSGATQVNIQTPTLGGVSMNQYTQFDTMNNGTIVNNARTNTNTVTAGWVQGNPWLANGSAKVIVNQVNSSNPSSLTGNIEIAGNKADFIIANPSGISIDGATIINAGGTTLTTGTLLLNNGNLDGFNVNNGIVSIQGAGLNALGSDYTSILARAAIINAGIWANEIKIVTGVNTVSADSTNIAANTPNTPAPLFAIDSSVLGGMYANKITLIGNESGVGINNAGAINASTIAIDANGMLTNTGMVAANTNAIKSTNLNNSGTISSNSKTTIDTGETLTNSGMINSSGELNINAKDIDNSLTGEISGTTNFINAGNTITNRGLIDGYNNIIKTGILENIGTGRIYGDWLALQAVTLNNIDEAVNSLNSSATIAARENLELGVQTLNNIEHSLIYSGGDMYIGGSLDENSLAIGKASEINNLSATIESNGYMSLASEKINNIDMHLVIEQVSGPTIYQELVKPASGANAGEFDLSSNFVGIKGSQDDNYHKDALVYMKQRDEYEAEYLKTHTGWQALTLYTDLEYQRLSAIIDSYIFENYTLLKQYSTTSHTELVSSDPAQIISGGDMYIDGLLHNKDSHVIAGGIIATTLNPENLETKGQDITSFDGSTIERTTVEGGYGLFGNEHKREWHGAASYDQADKKSELYSLGTSKYLENTKTAGNAIVIDALPTSSIYIISPNAPDYLVQTDPRFTNYKNFLSSDYMLSSLGIDSVDMHKRLGDGYYEQRLVQDQIASLTGKRFLDNYSDNEEQYKALMNAGVEAASQFNLTVGVALSAEQVARLTTDIVWMEEQTINGQKVLTPKVYLAANKATVNTNGALISASSIVTNGSNDLVNSGNIMATNVVNLNSTSSINNNTGTITANSVALRANDININGGTITASSAMILDAANNINISSTTYSTTDTDGTSDFSRTGIENTANVKVTGSDGMLLVNAGNDINLNGANIINKGALTQLTSDNDINLNTIQISQQDNVIWDSKNHLMEGYTYGVGSTIETNGDNTILAGNDINLRASTIDSLFGTTTLMAVSDVNILAGTDTANYDEATYIKRSSLLGTKKTTDIDTLNSTTSKGSYVGGDQVFVASGNDINVLGSNVISDNGTALKATNDINILASADTMNETHFNEVKKSGLFSSGGLSVTLGNSMNSNDGEYSATTQAGSMVGSLNGDVTINAGEDYKQVASSVLSGHSDWNGNFIASGDTSITAKSIDIEAGYNTYEGGSISKSKTSGLTMALSIPVVNAVNDAITSASDIGKSKNARVNAMAVTNTAIDAYQAKNAIGALKGLPDVTSIQDAASATGASLSVTVGSSQSKSTTIYEGTNVVSSTVGGKNVTLKATGDKDKSDINIAGSNISGVTSTTLSADHDVNILAAASTDSQHSTNKSSGWSTGVAISAGKEGVGVGIVASANIGKGKSDGESTTYTSSHVGSSSSSTTITAGDTTNIIGGQVLGSGVTLNTTNLNIESLQDSATYDSKQKNAAGSITVGLSGGVSGSISASKSNIDADYASVNEQSGILAGNGGYDIAITNHTNLIGGIITSTAKAEDEGLNSFSTGTLSVKDINNFSYYEGDSIGISATASYSFPSPETQTSATDTTTTPAAGQEEGKLGTSKSIGYGEDSDSQTSTTYAGINTSNITITGNGNDSHPELVSGSKEITAANLADIFTSTTTDTMKENSGSLKNTFDASAVQNELDVQTRVTQTFNENVTIVISQYVDAGQKEAKDKIKDINNQEQVLNDPNNTMTDEEKKAAYDNLEAQKTELYDDIYNLEYQRIALSTISSMLTIGDIEGPAVYGSVQTISTVAREESLNNSRLSSGIIGKDANGNTIVISNVSEESGAFDGVKLGGTRLDLDAICGENNERCRTYIDADGNKQLDLDALGRVQWNPEPETGAGMSLGAYMNLNAYDMGGATGGVQGLQGSFGTTPFVYNYNSGWFTDLLVENYSGIHDFIGGELPKYYDDQGNTVRGMNEIGKTIQNTWAAIAVPLATPFAISTGISYDTLKLIMELR